MSKLKKFLKWIGLVASVLVVIAIALYMIYLRPFMQKMKETSVIKYDTNLTLVLGGGGNSGVLTSDSLVLVIDTKMDEAAEALNKMVKELAGNKPVLVVNTHIHSDHSKGNKYYKGSTIIAGGNYTKEQWIKEAGEETLPTMWLKDRMDIPMGDDTVTLLNLPRHTHTTSDIVIYLHRRKMLFGGDVILNKQVPALFGDADPAAYLTAFDELPKQFDIQKIVPGHGDSGGIEILDHFREYFNDMELAAKDASQEDKLIAKYKDWKQIPMLMSPGATIRAIKKKSGQ